MEKKVYSTEEAIIIAEEYNLSWDRRAVIERIFYKYLCKSDFINDLPVYVIGGGFNNNYDWLRDVYTSTSIRDDTLVEFYALSAPQLGATGIEIEKNNLYIPTTHEIREILDSSKNSTGVDWRELNDFMLVVNPMQTGLHIRLIYNKKELNFYYKTNPVKFDIQKNEIINKK